MSNYIIEYQYIKEIEIDEIDFILDDELKIDSNMESDEIDNINTGNEIPSWAGESHPINIDRVIKILKKLKQKNKCKYVEIAYHTDHIGYIFSGLNIIKHSESDLKGKKLLEYKNKIFNKSINKKISILKSQLNELENMKKF